VRIRHRAGGRWQTSAYVILDDCGEPQAGIPFCRIADIMGERILALPFSDYCDPLVNDQECWTIPWTVCCRTAARSICVACTTSPDSFDGFVLAVDTRLNIWGEGRLSSELLSLRGGDAEKMRAGKKAEDTFGGLSCVSGYLVGDAI